MVAGRVATFSSGTGSFDMFGLDRSVWHRLWRLRRLARFRPASALRLDNSVLYQSPTFGGFKFGAGYSFNASGAEVAGSGNNTRYLVYRRFNFAAGPFFAAITYDKFDDIQGYPASRHASHTAGRHHEALQVGATFDLKIRQAACSATAKEDDQRFFNVVGITSGADADSFMVGLTFPLFGGSLFGSWQKYDGDPYRVPS